MTPIVMKLVSEAIHLAPDHTPPTPAREVTLRELCEVAGILCRVTIEKPRKILLHLGSDHYRSPNTYFVSVDDIGGEPWEDGTMSRVAALRVLEVLAYSFLDYGARESVCGRGLFVGRKPRGRPSQLGRRRTTAERMRSMRARRKVAGSSMA